MDAIKLTDKIEEVVIKNDLTSIASLLKNEYSISKSDELKKAISQIDEEGRLLKIGIVGRVKAGKSSLLNALVFDGEDILPKASIPMTAALTVLQYGDETKANVDFFTTEDIEDIKKDYLRYIQKLEETQTREFEKISKLKLKKEKKKELSDNDIEEVKKKAFSIAQREVKADDKLSSSYQQYEKIKNSGIDASELKKLKTIFADDAVELNNKLLEFVGADGKYMPFTKSVTLTLQQNNLKELQIIDTPGVNDPVSSREERTRELLKYCDVVLVVSPSGQFLSNEDIDLMDRITTKEGIKEIYVIASQVDNQLFGSEKDELLNKAIEKIGDKLTEQQKNILQGQKKQFPEIGNTFDSLIKNRVIISSSISFSMAKKYDNKTNWDENTQKVWENLTTNYKDFFSNKDTAISNLTKLANMDSIKKILKDVKSKKENILKEKKENFISTKQKALLEYKQTLQNDVKESIARVQNTDIDEIKKQKENMLTLKEKAVESVNESYLSVVEDLDIDLNDKLNDKVSSYFSSSRSDINNSEGMETDTWEESTSKWYNPLSWGSTTTKSKTYTTVKAGRVRESLEDLRDKLESTIEQDSKRYIKEWKKRLYKEIISTLRKEAGDEILEINIISKTIRSVLNSVNYPEITYQGNFPSSLKESGTLSGSYAERFLDNARDYLSDLKTRVKNDIKTYTSSLVNTLKSEDVAEHIFSKYTKEIEQLEKDIQNKELSLDRLNNILKQLENIND